MTLIANVFPKLGTPKNVVRYMSKKSRFKRPFDRQHVKRAKTLLRSERQHRYLIKKPDDDLFFNDDIIFNEESNKVIFLVIKWVFSV